MRGYWKGPTGIIKIQFVVLHRTAAESHHIHDSIGQTLLELCQDWCVATSLGSLFQGPTMLWVKNLFPISNLNLP